MFIIPTQPQTVWQVIRSGFSLWKSTFRFVWPSSIAFATFNAVYQYYYAGAALAKDSLNIGFVEPFFILGFLLFSILIISVIHRRRDPKSYQSLSVGTLLKKLWVYSMVVICTVLMLLLGITFFIIPGIILCIYLLFAPYIAVIDDQGIRGSIRSSFRLASKYWWFLCLRMICVKSVIFLLCLGLFLIGVGACFVFKGGIASISEHLLFLKSIILSLVWVFLAFFWPLADALYLEMLYDLRLRKASL